MVGGGGVWKIVATTSLKSNILWILVVKLHSVRTQRAMGGGCLLSGRP